MDLHLDAWWDEPDSRRAQDSFSTKGVFILTKLAEHDAALTVVGFPPHAAGTRGPARLRPQAPALRGSERRHGQRVCLDTVLVRWAHHAPDR
jgi:hypothetical protein